MRRYAAGRRIWSASDLPDRVFRLHTGRVDIVRIDANGHEQLFQRVAPGEIFGEMCFCAHRHEPHETEARCVAPSEVSAVSYREFRRRVQRTPSAVDDLLQAFCTRVAHAERRARILAVNDARRRLTLLLLDLAEARTSADEPHGDAPVVRTEARGPADVALTVSHATLAALAALSRPHVSVLMTEFRRRRLVTYRRGGPLHVRIAALRRMVGGT